MELYFKNNNNLSLKEDEYKILSQQYYFNSNKRDPYEEQKQFEELFYPLIKDNNVNINDWSVIFDTKARLICSKLLGQLVDNETVLITSTNEHDCLYNFVNNHPNVNVIYFNLDEPESSIVENLNRQLEGSKYKKAVVWGIGTVIDNGIKIPDSLYKRIKITLIKLNLEPVLIVDDCQAMYLTTRDYSLFDFVLGTGHVVYKTFDVGILLYKKKHKLNFGYTNLEMITTYINNLQIILKRKNELLSFAPTMENNEMLKEFIKQYGLTIYTNENSQKNIFTFGKEFPNTNIDEEAQKKLQDFYIEMKKHYIHIEGIEHQINSPKNYCNTRKVQIRLRSQDFLLNKHVDLIDKFIFNNKALTSNSLLIE